MPYWAAFFLTLAISFVGGVAIERIVIRPVEGAPVLTNVIVTLGLALLLITARRPGSGGRGSENFRSAFPTRPIHVGGVAFSIQDIGIIGVSIAAVVLLLGALLPVHEDRPRAARRRVQPGREPARRGPRRLDARARLGARGGARRGLRDDGRAGRLPRPEHDADGAALRASRPRSSAGSTARSARSSAVSCSASRST